MRSRGSGNEGLSRETGWGGWYDGATLVKEHSLEWTRFTQG